MTAESTFLRAHSRQARRSLSAAAGCNAVGAFLLIVQSWLLARAVDCVVFQRLDQAIQWPALAAIPVLIVCRAGLTWLAEYLAVGAAAAVKQTIRSELQHQLVALGPVRLSTQRTGALTAMLTSGVDALEPYFARFVPTMTNVAVIPLAILVVVVPLDWVSGLILALTAPLIPLFMVLIGKGAERLNQRQWAKLTRLGARLLDMIQNLTVLKLFNASRREAALIARLSDEYRLSTMAVLRIAFLSSLALEFFATVSIALVAVFIGFRLLSGDLAFERGFFILLLAPEFYLPLRTMGVQYHARMEAVGAATAMVELLGQKTPAPATHTNPMPAPATPPAITLQDVRLEYADGRIGLDGANLTIQPGRTTALVGASGAGKTSIVNILLGFATPTAGTVTIDGVSMQDLSLEAWRARIAWVPQRPYLFRGTIADNLRLGCPTASDSDLAVAATTTGADRLIDTLPKGFDTPIGEHGGGLSGGQARLIALTRAALRQAPLLILDEPTASLDHASEQHVTEAMSRLSVGRTVVVVAHRLDTIRTADTIAVVDRGRIVEQGQHETLMACGGAYAALVRQGEFLQDGGTA